jgi:protein phosphatase
VFVLCSDGLSGQVDDADIGAIARSLPAQQACQYLVDLANLRGGPDNITVVVVRVGEPIADPPAVTPPAARRLPPIPWKSPDLYLVLGAVIMLGAFLWGPVFGRNTPSFGFVYAWLVGWLLVVTGIAWRFLAKVRVEQPPAPEPRGYRDTPCALDDTLFQRLNSRLDQLRSLAIDEVWSMDWSQFFTCRNSGDKLLAAGDRTAALREFCQALHRLAIAQRRHQTSTHGLLGRQ